MASRVIPQAGAALRRRYDPKLGEKFNLAALNRGKNPFIVSSNKLLKVSKKQAKATPQQRVKDQFSLEYLLGDTAPATAQTAKTGAKTGAKKSPFDVASSKLM